MSKFVVPTAVQPSADVTVTEYVPSFTVWKSLIIGLATSEVKLSGPSHAYSTPPITESCTSPPSQITSGSLIITLGPLFTVTVVVNVTLHPPLVITTV